MTKATFFKRKNIEFSVQRYLIDGLGAMALGLFGTLIVGVILETLGTTVNWPALVMAGEYAKQMMGPGIAVAVAWALKAPPLVLFASVVAGFVGATLGGPVGAWVAAVLAVEFGKLVADETKLDIIVTPVTVILVGFTAARFIGPPIDVFMRGLGEVIMWATELHPFPMGIVVAVVMGWALTSPISSAALAIALELTGLAGGAALAGCAAHMVGFAVSSFPDNGWSGLVSQGLGTSMLQIPNIIRKPIIGLPATVASMAGGPLATLVFRMDTTFWAAGMGTSGLVGPIGTLTAMGADGGVFVAIILLHFLIPGLIAAVVASLMRGRGWLGPGDLQLVRHK